MKPDLHLVDLLNYPREPLNAKQIIDRLGALMLMEGLDSILNDHPLVVRLLNKEGRQGHYHLMLTGISFQEFLSLQDGSASVKIVPEQEPPTPTQVGPLWIIGNGETNEAFLSKASGGVSSDDGVSWIRFTNDPLLFKIFQSEADALFLMRHASFMSGVRIVKFDPVCKKPLE